MSYLREAMAETLYNILVHTYHPDKALRTHAEQALEEYIRTVPAALVYLLAIVKNREVDLGLRKAAAIQIKNKVRAVWREREGVSTITLSLENKEILKSEIILVELDETDTSVRKLLAESFRKMLELDYPDRWPNLVNGILALAQTDNVLRMHNAF